MLDFLQFTNVNGEAFVFNDTHSPSAKFDTSVEYRTNERPKALQHGIWQSYTYLGKRIVSIEGSLFGDSSADYITRRRAMKRVLTPRPQFGQKKIGTLYVTPTGFAFPLSLDCAADGDPELPIEGLAPQVTTYQVNLKSFDPRFYAPQSNVNIYPPTSGSGRTFGQTFPQTYVGTSGNTDTIVTNAGDIETYPQATIYGYCASPQLTLFRSDGSIFSVTFQDLVVSVGGSVTVDFKFRTAFTNNGQNVYNTSKGSSWWAIEPGPTNTVRYTAANFDSNSYANFRWSDAYML